MSISAYVFIECIAGGAREVAEGVSKIEGVQRSNATTGPYDVVALVQAENVHILGEFIVTKIQALPGVLRMLQVAYRTRRAVQVMVRR